MIIPFSAQNPSQNQHDLATKSNLLSRFTAQIAPSIHDQSDLLCSTLSLILLRQTIVDLYLSYLTIKTDESAAPNAQLAFLFHDYDPQGAVLSLEEILNLISTGDKDTKPSDEAPACLPAPFWELSEVQNRLADSLTRQMLLLCTNITNTLKLDETPDKPQLPIERQIEKLLRVTLTSLATFLPEESDETADATPAGIPSTTASSESDETPKEKINS